MSSVDTTLFAGTVIEGYVIERVEPVPYLQGTFYELKHQGTGARHIHIEVPDDNNAFVISTPDGRMSRATSTRVAPSRSLANLANAAPMDRAMSASN